MAMQYALTTDDNPYSPFDQFDEWLQYDNAKGYCSSALLARFARTSDSLTDDENDEEISRAIDEILKYDVREIYKKVSRPRPWP